MEYNNGFPIQVATPVYASPVTGVGSIRRWEEVLSPRDVTLFQQVMNHVTNATSMSRFQMARKLAGEGGSRNVVKDCHYRDSFSPEDWDDLYHREPYAARVVELFPKECFQVIPAVYETEDENSETPFEIAFATMVQRLNPEPSYQRESEKIGNNFWKTVYQLDVKRRIGRYAVAVIGLSEEPGPDGQPRKENLPAKTIMDFGKTRWTKIVDRDAEKNRKSLEKTSKVAEEEKNPLTDDPTQDVQDDQLDEDQLGDGEGFAEEDEGPILDGEGNPVEESKEETDAIDLTQEDTGGEPTTFQDVAYIRVFGEREARVSQWENNPLSPRYGLPTMYQISYVPREGDDGERNPSQTTMTIDVHWTRVVHVVGEEVGSNGWQGLSAMHHVRFPLQDLTKIRGIAGEAFWRSVMSILTVGTDPALGGETSIGESDKRQIRQQLESLWNGTQRDLILNGMTANMLSPSVNDPTSQIEANIQAIATYLGCPIRVFKGSERGELASSQDDDSWNDRLAHRQQFEVTPSVIVPLIDRLINLGCLPAPDEGYTVAWPDITSRSQEQKSARATAFTTALAQYVSGGLEAVISLDKYLVKYWDWDQEEAEEMVEEMEQKQAEAEAEQAMLEQANVEAGLNPDGTDPSMNPQVPPGVPQQPNGPMQPKDPPKPPTGNAFCPTGEGGGIDNSCGPNASSIQSAYYNARAKQKDVVTRLLDETDETKKQKLREELISAAEELTRTSEAYRQLIDFAPQGSTEGSLKEKTTEKVSRKKSTKKSNIDPRLVFSPSQSHEFEDDGKHLYHYANAKAIESIAEQGLRPGSDRGKNSGMLYAFKKTSTGDYADAMGGDEDEETGKSHVILRFKESRKGWEIDPELNENLEEGMMSFDHAIRKKTTIDPSKIEIYTAKKKWERLPDFISSVKTKKVKPKATTPPGRTVPPIRNAFCPTGEGGGIDNSCSPKFERVPPQYGLIAYVGGGTLDDGKDGLSPARAQLLDGWKSFPEDAKKMKKDARKKLDELSPGTKDIQLYHVSGSDLLKRKDFGEFRSLTLDREAAHKLKGEIGESATIYSVNVPKSSIGIVVDYNDPNLKMYAYQKEVINDRPIPISSFKPLTKEEIVIRKSDEQKPVKEKTSKTEIKKKTVYDNVPRHHLDEILKVAEELKTKKYTGKLPLYARVNREVYSRSGKSINLSGYVVEEILKDNLGIVSNKKGRTK